ncbi:MAG: hypothetical protein HOP30_00560 [Cyclobacteriaceae bacterium]|nr:hypothetical protein [Cyclobacteriaceae bacterium]
MIGGHAAVFYGVRRTTSDIDILVQPTLENGHRIIRAFQDLKLEINSIQASDFTMEQLFTFGVEPNAVDILNFSKGVSVETIFKNALSKKIDDFAVKIIDIRDLVKNKESLNRTGEKKLTDQLDILALRRILKSK